MTLAASATRMLGALMNPRLHHQPVRPAKISPVSGILSGDDFLDGFKSVLGVAGIDSFRRITDFEIAAGFQPRFTFQDGNADLFGAAGIDRRFVDDDRSAVRFFPIRRLASTSGERSGLFALSTGVGTATMIRDARRSCDGSKVNSSGAAPRLAVSISPFRSEPFFSSAIRSGLMSKPMVGKTLLKAVANGSPTYPRPMTATCDGKLAVMNSYPKILNLWQPRELPTHPLPLAGERSGPLSSSTKSKRSCLTQSPCSWQTERICSACPLAKILGEEIMQPCHFFTLDDFRQLVRAAENAQSRTVRPAFHGSSSRNPIGRYSTLRILTALPHDDLAAVARAVDQHRNFFLRSSTR